MDKRIVGFKNIQQAKHISRMDDLAPTTPYLHQQGLEVQPHIRRVSQVWWCEVKENETIPAGSKLVPQGGIVWLLERKATGLDYYLFPASGGQKIEEYVFNPHDREYVSGDRFIVVGDMDGDLWIIEGEDSRVFVGNLADPMCTTDASVLVYTITNVDTGEAMANRTVLNSFVKSGIVNDLVLFRWIERFNDYVITTIQHHLVSALVEGSVYMEGAVLKGLVIDISTEYCGPPRIVTLLTTNTQCPPPA